MLPEQTGRRFPLRLYRSIVKRYRRPTFILALLLFGLWLPTSRGLLQWPPAAGAGWLLAGGVVATVAWLYAIIGPNLAYVQPRANHLRLQTPIYRLKISYRRILSTRPVDLRKTFPTGALRGAAERSLRPFRGETALGVDLRGFPLRPWLLRLFFHPSFIAPDRDGLILIIDDWMKLSEQLADQIESDRVDPVRRISSMTPAGRILSDEDQA